MDLVNKHSKTNFKSRTRWSEFEINKLYELVDKYGVNWNIISIYLTSKTKNQCRVRWYNYPSNIEKTKMTVLEKIKLQKMVEIHGTKWIFLREKYFPNRAPKQLYNNWISFNNCTKQDKIVNDDELLANWLVDLGKN